MELQKEDCWALLGTNPLPHLRSFLRGRPDFDPALPLERQKGLGEKWAKEFWDQEYQKGPPSPQWLNAWTAIASQSGSRSRDSRDSQEKLSDLFTNMIEANEDVQEIPQPDDSIFSDDDEDEVEEESEDEGDKLHITTGIRFVASASAASDRDLRGMLSGKQLKLYEKTLEEAIMRDERCFHEIRRHVERALQPDTRRRGAVRTGDPSFDQLRLILDCTNRLFNTLRAKMVLPYSAKDTILRPLDRHLEPGVRAAHSKSGRTEGLSELLDQLDGLLAALGVPAARPETVISDRLVHQYLYRLSDCRERIMSHEQDVDARRMTARAARLPSGLVERKRYVSRPLVCRGGSPTLTALCRDGASSRASSASVGSFVAGSSGSSQEGDDAGEQTVIEHETP